jgi:hypothetical protein
MTTLSSRLDVRVEVGVSHRVESCSSGIIEAAEYFNP